MSITGAGGEVSCRRTAMNLQRDLLSLPLFFLASVVFVAVVMVLGELVRHLVVRYLVPRLGARRHPALDGVPADEDKVGWPRRRKG